MPLKTSLSPSQNLLLETVYKQRRVHLRTALSDLPKKDLEECKRVSKEIVADPKVRIVVNANLRLRVHKYTLAEALLACGRLLNLFELDTALGNEDDYNMRLRLFKEFRIYGAKQGIESMLAHLPDGRAPHLWDSRLHRRSLQDARYVLRDVPVCPKARLSRTCHVHGRRFVRDRE